MMEFGEQIILEIRAREPERTVVRYGAIVVFQT